MPCWELWMVPWVAGWWCVESRMVMSFPWGSGGGEVDLERSWVVRVACHGRTCTLWIVGIHEFLKPVRRVQRSIIKKAFSVEAQYHPYLRVHCGIASSFWSTTTISGDSPWLTLLWWAPVLFWGVIVPKLVLPSRTSAFFCAKNGGNLWGRFPRVWRVLQQLHLQKIGWKHTLKVGVFFQNKDHNLPIEDVFLHGAVRTWFEAFTAHIWQDMIDSWGWNHHQRIESKATKNVSLKKFERTGLWR